MSGENERVNTHENDNEIENLFDDPNPNTWIATGEMGSLPTNIFKKNTLSQPDRKTVLQSEPRNKAISFEPPVMDRKIWNNMSQNAKENDKNIRRIIYHFSATVRPIDNTLRMV